MKILSIDEWQSLALENPVEWSRLVRLNLDKCIEKTDTSVVSSDLSSGLMPLDGPLGGVPFGLKDLFKIHGVPTHSSSVLPFLKSELAECDSELVQRLDQLGASCAAKAQMNEFAYGLSGENPHYGNCPHPYLENCLSGGSSSGSAHLVAAGYLPLAFGTDTGGSIRLPAAWCGVYGIRWAPNYFMEGGFPLAPSFDTMGWFTRTAEEMAQVILSWFDGESFDQPSGVHGTFFLPEDMVAADTYAALKNAAKRWGIPESELAAELKSILPACQKAFNILQSREAYIIHQDWLDAHGSLYDPVVKDRIERAKIWKEEEVERALATWDTVRVWFNRYFESYDFLAMPVSPGPSIPLSEATPELRENTLRLTTPASIAQKPALTIPVWLDGHRSVGMQFIFKDTSPEVPLALLEQCKSF